MEGEGIGVTLEHIGTTLARLPRAAWLILALALVLRLVIVVATPDYRPLADSADYDRHARSIAAGDGYPRSEHAADGGETAFRPPGYPVFLAAVYKATGNSWTAGRLAQALLGVAAVALIGLIAWQLWDRLRALAAMGVAAIAPPLLVPLAALLSDPLFLVLMLGAVAAMLEHRRSGDRYRWALTAGALCGLAVLTRTNGLILLPLLMIGVWTLRPLLSWRAIAAPAALLATALLVIAPWTVRNAIVFDAFVPVSTQGGFTLAVTYNDAARLDPTHPSLPHYESEHTPTARRTGMTEAELDDALRARAVRYMREHPWYLVQTAWRNAGRALHFDGFGLARTTAASVGTPRWLADVGVVSFYVIGLAMLVGAFLPPARRAPLVMWAIPVLMLASAILISGKTRYRVIADPFIIMLAALAVSAAIERARARFRSL